MRWKKAVSKKKMPFIRQKRGGERERERERERQRDRERERERAPAKPIHTYTEYIQTPTI